MRGVEFLCAVLLLTGAGLLAERQQALADAVSIYKCEVGGVLTFSDRPCSSEAELHELDETAVNTYEAPPVTPSTSKPSAAARKRTPPRHTDSQQDKRAETCTRVGRSMKEVRSKMRAGYSAKEGERLRERLAKLKDQQREYRCS
jgi:hypothetical protein